MPRRVLVVASVPNTRLGLPRYNVSPSRQHASPWCFIATVGLLLTASATAGCSFSYQLDNVSRKRDEQVAALRAATRAQETLAEGDLDFARAAAREVLSKGGSDASMSWENPSTGARGTVTPLAQAYRQEDGTTCRDFLASYVRNGSESWLEGEACRASRGAWEVRRLRPRN